MRLDGSVAETGPEISNLFAQQFSSVYSSNLVGKTELSSTVQKVISKIQFTERDVLKKLKKLDSSKGSGPDCIPPIFIKQCCKTLAFPLCLIFNRSLTEGVFPELWKQAKIFPIYKKDDPADVKKYRPISILSCFPKIFESLICPIITHHFDSNISPCQHGFKAGRSVESNLVQFVSDISESLDKRLEVDAVYTDFSSAFDKVSHSLLLSKLAANGVHGSLLRWFTSYLQQRSQTVVLNGYTSQPYVSISGVPQGSHLAPILFSLFINDLAHQIKNCKFLMFADDLKIYKTQKLPNDSVAI